MENKSNHIIQEFTQKLLEKKITAAKENERKIHYM